MLIRPHDAPIDAEHEWRYLVVAHPFGHLIAPGTDRELPVVVPTHIHFDGDVTIRLHLAVVTAAVACVPTSHYASVHLGCTATITDEPDELFGDPLGQDIPYTAELRQIRGLEPAITDVRAKFKFDGAEPDSVRRQVVDGYERRNTSGDHEALAHLVRRHPPATAAEEVAAPPAAPRSTRVDQTITEEA